MTDPITQAVSKHLRDVDELIERLIPEMVRDGSMGILVTREGLNATVELSAEVPFWEIHERFNPPRIDPL